MEALNVLYSAKVAEFEVASAVAKKAYQEGSPDAMKFLMAKDVIHAEFSAIADQMRALARRNNSEPS